LQMACKAINDSTGPKGLVPTLLVFGAYFRVSEVESTPITISQRSTAIRKAMAEISKIRTETSVQLAINMQNGLNTDSLYDLLFNSKVLVYREKNKWTGPYNLVGIISTTARVELSSGITDFRTTQVKPYYEQNDREEEDESTDKETAIIKETETPPISLRPKRIIQIPKRYSYYTADVSIYLTIPQYQKS